MKRGRETALRNRQKKAKLKKIDKEEKVNAEEAKLSAYLKKKQAKEEALSKVEKLRAELKALREEKAKASKVDVVSEVAEPAKKPKKVVKEKPVQHNSTEENKVIEKTEPEPAPAPVVATPKKPEMSRKQLLRMMKGI